MTSKSKVLGRRVDFDNGRIVFLGESAGNPDIAYVGFRNAEGDDLYMKLSWEALDALVALRTNPSAGGEKREYPHNPAPELELRWRQVVPNDVI